MKKRVLVISPHPDDETLGLGGSIAKMVSEDHDVYILTVSGHLPPLYSREDYDLTISEALEAYNILGVKNSKLGIKILKLGIKNFKIRYKKFQN